MQSMLNILGIIFIISTLSHKTAGIPVDPYKPIKVRDENNIHLAFGSCFKQEGDEEGRIFNQISKHNPDLFIWLGDATYADDWVLRIMREYAGKERAIKRFENTKSDPFYASFINKTQMVGIWDDHDYGTGNGDKNFQHKDEMKEVFLNFIDEPAKSSRLRAGDGIYTSYYIGQNKRVKLILLDLRYNLDTDGGKDMLGEAQWEWLENELKTSKADFILLGSTTQFLPDDHLLGEKWFEWSKERLYKIIRDNQVNGVVILSGDVHMAMLLEHPCSRKKVGYPLYELTSSGMTHTIQKHVPRIAEFKDYLFPPTYYAGAKIFVDFNYATVDIEFWGDVAQLVMRVRDENGEVVIEQFLKNTELRTNGKFDDGYCITDDKGPILRNLEHLAIHIKFGNEWAIIGVGIILAIFIAFMVTAFVIYLILAEILKLFIKCFCPKKNPSPANIKKKVEESKATDPKKKTQ